MNPDLPAELASLRASLRDLGSAALAAIGFACASLDLKGYRTGSLNETLNAKLI